MQVKMMMNLQAEAETETRKSVSSTHLDVCVREGRHHRRPLPRLGLDTGSSQVLQYGAAFIARQGHCWHGKPWQLYPSRPSTLFLLFRSLPATFSPLSSCHSHLLLHLLQALCSHTTVTCRSLLHSSHLHSNSSRSSSSAENNGEAQGADVSTNGSQRQMQRNKDRTARAASANAKRKQGTGCHSNIVCVACTQHDRWRSQQHVQNDRLLTIW